MTKTHVPDDILLDYVTGTLAPGYAVVTATHIEGCRACAKSAARLQAVGGEVLDTLKPTAMTASAEDVLALAKADVQTPRKADTKTVPPLEALIGDDLNVLPFKTLTKGIGQHIIEIDGKASLRLLWIEPGKAVPAHGHGGLEMTQTMVGGYFVGDEAYTTGDVQCVDHETPHQPIAMKDGPCIVLAATDEPLRFQNFLPRLFQPLFNI